MTGTMSGMQFLYPAYQAVGPNPSLNRRADGVPVVSRLARTLRGLGTQAVWRI